MQPESDILTPYGNVAIFLPIFAKMCQKRALVQQLCIKLFLLSYWQVHIFIVVPSDMVVYTEPPEKACMWLRDISARLCLAVA